MQYGLTSQLLKELNKPITIMHPGPINRGIEISSAIADSDQAIILNQVENGVAISHGYFYTFLAQKNRPALSSGTFIVMFSYF